LTDLCYVGRRQTNKNQIYFVTELKKCYIATKVMVLMTHFIASGEARWGVGSRMRSIPDREKRCVKVCLMGEGRV
jgi:hypothetical protein